MLPMHCQTAGVSLTALQPLNNLARVAYQSMAAALGGTQSLHTNSFDEAVMRALRTQQILALETGVTGTPDPFVGSYYLEALTADIEKRAALIMARIKELGGVVPALEQGYFHREIAETSYRFELDQAARRRKIVGVNTHETGGKIPPILKIDHAVEKGQVRRLMTLKRERDNGKVASCLERLRAAAKSETNLLPLILESVEACATVGEVTQALKDVFGEYPVFAGGCDADRGLRR